MSGDEIITGDEGFEIIKCEDVPQDIDAVGPDTTTEIGHQQQDENKAPDSSKSRNMLGYRVELKWSSGRWYRGTICEYNDTKRKHKVMYDDGDMRWYYLPEMVFRFVEEDDEWVKC